MQGSTFYVKFIFIYHFYFYNHNCNLAIFYLGYSNILAYFESDDKDMDDDDEVV